MHPAGKRITDGQTSSGQNATEIKRSIVPSIKTEHNVTENTSMMNKDEYIPPVKLRNRSYLSGGNF